MQESQRTHIKTRRETLFTTFFFFLFTLPFLSKALWACPTDIPSQIYFIGEESNYQEIKKCTQVMPLSDYIKKSLKLSKDHVIKVSSLSNLSQSLDLEKGESLSFKCQSCENLGPFNMQIFIKKGGQTSYELWASGEIFKRTHALVAKKQMGIANELSKDDFKLEYKETLNPERFFLKKEDLKFYQLNQTLHENAPLEASHLRKIPLINANSLVSVLLTKGPLKLTKKATSLSSGKIHEEIKLRENKNGKIFTATIIDFNKALIQL